jgi:hypothetical protein
LVSGESARPPNHADGGTVDFSYDGDGRVLTNGNGTFTYDGNGHMLRRATAMAPIRSPTMTTAV